MKRVGRRGARRGGRGWRGAAAWRPVRLVARGAARGRGRPARPGPGNRPPGVACRFTSAAGVRPPLPTRSCINQTPPGGRPPGSAACAACQAPHAAKRLHREAAAAAAAARPAPERRPPQRRRAQRPRRGRRCWLCAHPARPASRTGRAAPGQLEQWPRGPLQRRATAARHAARARAPLGRPGRAQGAPAAA